MSDGRSRVTAYSPSGWAGAFVSRRNELNEVRRPDLVCNIYVLNGWISPKRRGRAVY